MIALHNMCGKVLSEKGLRQAHKAVLAARAARAPVDVVVQTMRGDLACHVTVAGVLYAGSKPKGT